MFSFRLALTFSRWELNRGVALSAASSSWHAVCCCAYIVVGTSTRQLNTVVEDTRRSHGATFSSASFVVTTQIDGLSDGVRFITKFALNSLLVSVHVFAEAC